MAKSFDRRTTHNNSIENIDSTIFQSLFENSLSGILYGNPTNGNILDANQSAATMFGYTIEELRTLNRNDVFDYNHSSMINSINERQKQGHVKGELIGVRKNGEHFPIEFTSSIFTLKNGETRTSTILNDITDRKKSEEAVGLLLNNTEESFVLINKLLEIVSFNIKFQSTFKLFFQAEVQKGASILGFVQKERIHIVEEIYRRVLHGEVIDDVIIVSSHNKAENYFNVRYKPAHDYRGNIIGAFVTLRDITEKRKAIAEKEFEQRNKEALINATSDLIWSVSKDFKLIAANQSFIKTMKIVGNFDLKSGDNLLFKGDFDPEFIAFWKQMYYRGLAGESFNFQTKTPTGYPDLVYLETTINPIYEGEKIVGIACYSRDITERKSLEKALEKTIDLLNRASRLAKIGGWEMNLVNNEYSWSAEIYHILKVGRDFTPTGDSILNFFTPESRILFENAIENSIDEGASWNLDLSAYTATGQLIDISAQGAAVVENSKTTRLLGTLQDVTEIKLSDKKLRESEERYRTMVEFSPDSIVVHANEKILYVNPIAVKMFGGQSLNDIIGKSILDIIHPDYHKLIQNRIQNTISGIKNDVNLDYKLIMLNGETRDIVAEGTAIIYNGVPAIHTVMKDVTQRKKEENLLRLLESVVTHTNDSVMITDADSFDEPGPRIVYVNAAFTKMTGYLPEDVIGRSPRILQGPNTDPAELKRLSDAIRKWKPCEITVVNYKKNGDEFWINFSVKPVADSTGCYTHWISVERDVTHQKNSELEREQIISELSQNNKDLKQFSYVTSHNLRAPIANLLGLTSLIDQYKIPNKSLKQIIDGVRQSALMFDDTVKDLSKVLVIKDQTNIIKVEVNFATVVNNVLKQLGVALEDHTVKINYKFADAPFVLFTPSYMESVLLNLFTNAIKYKSLKRKLKIDIVSNNTDDFVILKFKDNGIGIDIEKYKDKVFKLYQRFHDNPDGKGLGLYLVKSQIEALGGSITLESEVNKGTTFIIKFKK
jgi:PAS domain S-box-containing protein